MKTIAIASQKGGVGKTTTAWALSHFLGMQGYRVLAVDMDSQINLSEVSGNIDEDGKTIYDALTHPEKTSEYIQKRKNYDILIGSQYLPNKEYEIFGKLGREFYLKESLKEIEDDYDFCIIDTSPSLSMMTINAMTCADTLIIPALAENLSYLSLDGIFETFQSVKKYSNNNLQIGGILITRHNPRTKLSQNMMDFFKEKVKDLGIELFETTIRESTTIREAQTVMQSPFSYAPKAPVIQDYSNFCDEFLKELENE